MTTRQFLADSLDQLDLALDQIALRERNFDRFALMLVDNVVELALHRFAEERLRENKFWERYAKPKYDSKAVSSAVNGDFRSKVSLASKLGLLSVGEADSIRSLHGFRNTAYHRGVRHETILHSIAIFYLKCACSLFIKYEPSQSSGSDDVVSARARKYIGSPSIHSQEGAFREAWRRISQISDTFGFTL